MTAPRLDAGQAAAVAHRGGVLQVVGGPGTGKTTVAVEAVADRVHRDGLPADSALLLAPTRVAAGALRVAVTRRLAATTTEPLARTPSALAFAVLRQAAALGGEPAPRLLSGAEQDLILSDLLAGHAAGSAPAPDWPDSVRGALGTRGFRDQLRDLLMRAVEHGLDPADLMDLAQRHQRPEWRAAAQVLEEYDQVTALRSPGAFDPAWICTAAADLLEEDPAAARRVRRALRLVVVDDAHELTASASRLLRAMHDPATDLLLLGDGDLTVQGFRGADPARFDRVAADLAGPDGPTRVVLTTQHRMPEDLATAARRVADRIGVSTGTAHRATTASRPGGGCAVVTVRTTAQETAYVADRLRRAHLLEGVPWSRMAVIARSRGRHDGLRRGFASAGVPVVVPGGTLPLRDEPVVRALLTAFAVALRDAAPDGQQPGPTPEEAVDLVTSVLGGADPVTLLRLRRALRVREHGLGSMRAPEEALAELLAGPVAELADDPDLGAARAVARVLQAGRAAAPRLDSGHLAADVTAESVLWSLWQASGLSDRWARQAVEGGAAGVRADHDLDAVMMLFDAASSYVERLPGMGPAGFLEHVAAQEVRPDSLVARARPDEAVEILTPQGAAGREWDLVAVVGVQEGVWPDLRLRDTLLGSEALVSALRGRPFEGPEGVRAAQGQVRADETRQFYSAITRSRADLVVTAVAGTEEQPSSFLDLLDPDGTGRRVEVVPPALTLRGLVAGLRRDLVLAHRGGDLAARDRAAARLERLAAEGITGADPDSWWEARAVSDGRPLQETGPVRVSPSRVQTFDECALRWLLSSRGGDPGGAASASLGTLVHDVISEQPEADLETLDAALEERWPELGLGHGWADRRDRDRARDMLRRYVGYVDSSRAAGYELAAVEIDLDVPVGSARITGRADRVERDPEGRLRIVDLKTGASKPTAPEVARHPQLGVYQVAVSAAEDLVGEPGDEGPVQDPAESGGAALVHIGRAAGKAASVQPQRPLRDDDDPRWAHDLLERTAVGMAGSSFPATVGGWCRTCAVKFSCPLQPEGRTLR